MNNLISKIFIYSSLFLGSVNGLLAQVPAPKSPPQLVTFYMVGGRELQGEFDEADKPATFKFRTIKGVKEITIIPGMPSPTFTRKPSSKITIFKEQPASDPSKPPEVVTLAEAEVSTSWRNVLVLVHLNEADGRISIHLINQSFDALPPASVSFHNFTRVPFAIKMGEGQGVVKPLQCLVLPVGLPGDEAAMVRIQVAAEIDGQAQLLSSGTYGLGAKERRIVLLAPGQTSKLRMTLLDATQPDPVDLYTGVEQQPKTH